MRLNAINTERLKEARLYRKMTMEELADVVGVQKQAISQFENKKASPDPLTLKKIAEALDFSYRFFVQENQDIFEGNTYFRKLYSSRKKDQAAQQIKARYIAQIYAVLGEYISFKPLNLPEITERITIEEAAKQVREYWGLGDAPIPNMVSLLEHQGIVIAEFATDGREIDAFYQYNEINGIPSYSIILGTDKSNYFRRQFNCAHELGHMIIHEKYDDLSELSREDYRKREDQANAFAAAFLLPKKAFGNDVMLFPNKLDYYIELKKKWGVSMSAMIMRARNLDIITANQYTYMMRQISAKGYRTQEPLDNEVEYKHPRALKQAVNLLINSGKFSGSQILEMFADKGIALSASVLGELLNMDANIFKTAPTENNVLVFMKS